MFKKKSVLSLLLTGVLALSLTIPAHAADSMVKNKLSDEDKAKYYEAFTLSGIPKDTQDKLIIKLENGEVLDALNGVKLSTGKSTSDKVMKNGKMAQETVTVYQDGTESHTITTKIDKENGGTLTESKTVFEDGSVSTQSVETNPSLISCGSFGGGYCTYDRVKVKENILNVVEASFFAKYTHVGGGGYDYIDKVYQDYNITTRVGDWSEPSDVTIEQKYETSSNAAIAWLRFKYSPPVTGATTYYVRLLVWADMAISQQA